MSARSCMPTAARTCKKNQEQTNKQAIRKSGAKSVRLSGVAAPVWMKREGGALLLFAALAVGACSVFGSSSDDSPAAPATDDGGGADGIAATDTQPDPLTGVPQECLDADMKDKPQCIDEKLGVFVDAASGDDANDGSRGKPLKTL